MRNAAGEFDHLEPALDVALGVGNGLAVLAGQKLGEFVIVALRQFEELHHHAGAALRIVAPHSGCAALAFSTAARSSALVASATWAWTSPVIGSKTSAKRRKCP